MASEIRVDKLKNTLGIGTITLSPTGQELLGITTTSVLKVTDGTNSTSSTTGALIVTGGVGIAASLNVGGSVSIGGTLTYEDVTNIDSVGVITARAGIKVGSGVTLSEDGHSFHTGIITATNIKITTGANAFETSANVFKGTSGQKGVYLRSALSSATTPSYSSVDDTDTGIFLPGSDVFGVTTGGSERLRINSSGNVGIGTDNPTQELTVHSSAFTSIVLKSDRSTATDQIGGLSFYNHAGVSTATINGLVNGTLLFKTVGTERARIDTAGRLLLGVTSADQTTSMIISGNSTTGATGQAILNLDIGTTSVSDGTSIGVFRFGATGDRRGADVRAEGAGTWSAGSSHPTDLIFGTNASSQASTPTERLRITSDGKLGVNVESPGCLSGGIHLVHSAAEGTPTFTGGEVAIFQRNYNNAQSCEIGIIGGSVSNADINFGDKDDADTGKIRYDNNQNSFRFFTNGTNERVRIQDNGDIGIIAGGTTATEGAGEVTWPTGGAIHLRYGSANTGSTAESFAVYIDDYVGADLMTQKSLIGMALHDGNANSRPQVKFGAEVGERGDANTVALEGSGNFVVYTSDGHASDFTDKTTEKFVVKYDGSASISGSNVTSDVRLKTEIATLSGTLDKVKQLRGVQYIWNDVAIDNRGMRNRTDGLKQIGVVADEVKLIYPELVSDNGLKGRDETWYKEVSYDRFVPILIEAVKELAAKVEALEST